MMQRQFFRGLVLAAMLALKFVTVSGADPAPRTVVILLFDGFAPALLADIPAPNLERLRQDGAWSHNMLPPFPTISLISQTTISTGCWPEHHGIVTNVFLDPQRGEYDHSKDADWLTGCENLHQAAERQGVRAAAYGWAGFYSTEHGEQASRVSTERAWKDYPKDPQRAEQVIQTLQLPLAQRPRLIEAYFSGPDDEEHFKGMDSAETRQAVIDSDKIVGDIRAVIENLPDHDQITLLVTTDHGMLPVTHNVNVQKILLNNSIAADFRSTGTTSFIYLKDKSTKAAAVAALSKYTQFEVLLPEKPPSYWHLGNGPRVGDIVISAKPPYFIEDVSRWPWFVRWLGNWGPEFLRASFSLKATHGYPPATPGMAGIFYAWGAGIARGHEVKQIDAIDIHPLAARLLGIQPGNPVDGHVVTECLSADQSE
jgi:predicted AlkP superfamily pyrophosphatase or phosphodiesterase